MTEVYLYIQCLKFIFEQHVLVKRFTLLCDNYDVLNKSNHRNLK